LIETKNFNIAFNDNPVLTDINIKIPQGKFTVILGHSGSGKSVLTKSIIGLFRHFTGEIKLDDSIIDYNNNQEVYKLRKRVGMLFQSGALFDSMDVYQNIAFPLFEHSKMKESDIEKRVSQLLDQVNLPNIANKYPAELSGGMKRRVALARAISMEPDYLIYDEPTTGLDPVTSKGIVKLIANLHTAVIKSTCVITHDFLSFADLCQFLIVLDKGKCLFSGNYSPDIIKRQDIRPLVNM
jgi:phospholipid/cholesterol/gamma-HCH transport system ATP-binding protein